MGTLTWNRIGESLGRTGAACQLHWKTMKNMNTIKSHIEYIKVFSNNNDKNYQITKESLLAIHNKYVNSNYYHHHSNQRTKGNFDDDIDIDLLKTVDNVLKTNQWRCSMLDVLWKNLVKELEKDKIKERERQQSIHLSTTSTALSTSSSPPSPSSPSSSPSSPSSASSCSPKSGSKIKTENIAVSIENSNPNIWKTQSDVIKCIDNPPNTHTVSKIKPKKIKKQKKTKEKKKKKNKKKKQCKKNKVPIINEVSVETDSSNNNSNIMESNNNGNNTLSEDDKKGRSSRSNARWTKQEEDTLIKMLAQPSYSIEDIAKELGRSTNAISQHRLAMKHKHAKLRQSLLVLIC